MPPEFEELRIEDMNLDSESDFVYVAEKHCTFLFYDIQTDWN